MKTETKQAIFNIGVGTLFGAVGGTILIRPLHQALQARRKKNDPNYNTMAAYYADTLTKKELEAFSEDPKALLHHLECLLHRQSQSTKAEREPVDLELAGAVLGALAVFIPVSLVQLAKLKKAKKEEEND